MIRKLGVQAREDAFTLVELLVAVLIIGVLTAIAVPAFLNQRKAAYDAALESDLRNMGGVVRTWLLDHTAQDYNQLTRGKQVSYLLGEGSRIDYVITEPEEMDLSNWRSGTEWNMVDTLPSATASPGSVVELVLWKDSNSERFCLVGSNHMSHYNYVPGSGSTSGKADAYSRLLYYDSMFGGVRTIEELNATDGIENSQCWAHVNAYRTDVRK